MCNVYSRFVKCFAKISPPSNRKTVKRLPSEFEFLTDKIYEAFVELKKCLVSPPIPALLCYGKKYNLDTDACPYHLSCTLLQKQPSDYRLTIDYWSRALTDAEKNDTTTENEWLIFV